MKYRPEIDGLRAVAIIPVILSHAGFQMFSGGFIGVDIFFVISGYLITSIILREKRNGSFSLFSFYERRVRRIIPPLFTMMAASAVAAYTILTPSEMKKFSQSLVSVIFSSSNILFWRTHGYFEASSTLKPLLHTWSLGVEEQFYLIYPILFLFRWRDGSRKLSIIILILIACSFIFSEFCVKTHPSFAFYLLPTRAWEILIGALVAVTPQNQNDCSNVPIAKLNWRKLKALVFGSIGIVSILLPVFMYDDHTSTPGKNIIIPAIGTALIIHYANADNLIGRILGIAPLRWLGLLSYSAYLWHQPIFVFARYSFGSRLNSGAFLFIIVFVFILAYASYRFVENPWRNQKQINRSKGGLCLVGVASVLFVFGVAGHMTKGYPNRFSKRELDTLDYFNNSLPEMKYYYSNKIGIIYRDDCNFYNISAYKNGNSTAIPISTNLPVDCFSRKNPNSKVVFLWGDSHAQHLYSGLKKNMPDNWEILQVASSGCHPKIVSESSPNNYCDHSNWFALNAIKNSHPDVVVISQDFNNSLNNINSIYNELRKNGVARVVFVGPNPRWLIPMPEILIKTINSKTLDPIQFIDKNILEEDRFLKQAIQSSESLRYISAVDCFLEIPGYIFVGDNSVDNLIMWDTNHLTLVGSDFFAKQALVREITGTVE